MERPVEERGIWEDRRGRGVCLQEKHILCLHLNCYEDIDACVHLVSFDTCLPRNDVFIYF